MAFLLYCGNGQKIAYKNIWRENILPVGFKSLY